MRELTLLGVLACACGSPAQPVEPAPASKPELVTAQQSEPRPQAPKALEGIELASTWIDHVVEGRIDAALAAMKLPFLWDGGAIDDVDKLRKELGDAHEQAKQGKFRLTGINDRPIPEKLPREFPKVLPAPYDGLEAYIATVGNDDKTHAMTVFVHDAKVIGFKD